MSLALLLTSCAVDINKLINQARAPNVAVEYANPFVR